MNTPIKQLILLAGFGLAALSINAAPDERVDHFKGKPAPTLEVALANLATYNAKLADLISGETLTAQAMVDIHEISYTLENAFETIAREHARLADLLEEVHLASERLDSATIKASGQAFLTGTAPLTRAAAPKTKE
ncbi:MAG: hypothetical protein JJT96_02155 [Opitutales bacterium]|nr:hypothetical protein [Opitutales bacterium]